MARACVERVIVAGIEVSTGDPIVMTSPDGSTWTEVPTWPGGAADEVSVAGNTYFVATAAASTADNYAYSIDGDNWTLDSSTPVMQAVAWTGTEFVNVQSTAAYVAPAADGPWTGAYATGTSNTMRRLMYRDGVLVGVGTGGGSGQPPIIWSSDAAVTWSTYTPTNNVGVGDVDYGAGRFVAVRPRFGASASDSVITSTDGTSWSLVTTGVNDHGWYTVRYGNGTFVAVGINNAFQTRVMTSASGTSGWSVSTPSGLLSSVTSVCHLAFWNGLFILVNQGSGSIYTSSDGVNWTATAFTDRDWRGVAAGTACGGGIYVDGAVHF